MISPQHDQVLRNYLFAKDLNRPHLMHKAFDEQGSFSTQFNFATNFFEAGTTVGRAAITDVFRRLSVGCENIYTFCTPESVQDSDEEMSCKWIVGMQDRPSGQVRIAWGDYVWSFEVGSPTAKHLAVTMEHMAILPPKHAESVATWMGSLPEIWCSGEELLESMPDFDQLEGVADYFGDQRA